MSTKSTYGLEDWQAYKAGELSSSDANAFERWMLENPAEADALEGMSAVSENDLKQGSSRVESRIDAMTSQKASSPRTWAVAASVAVLALCSWWFIEQRSDNDLYSQYYETYTSESGTLRGDKTAFSDPYEFYTAGEYQKSIEAISKIPADQLEPEMALIEALCHVELGEFEKAIPKFPESGLNATVNETSGWYKALTYLKLGHVDACRATLKSVIKQKGFYMNDAKQLREKLGE